MGFLESQLRLLNPCYTGVMAHSSAKYLYKGVHNMDQVTNSSVATLTVTLLGQLRENGFAASAIERTSRLARYLSNFMEQNDLQTYDESVGSNFLDDICQRRAASTQLNIKLFIVRMNAILHGEGLITHRKMSKPEELPIGLENLLICYKEHCSEAGLHFATIQAYEKRCHMFLYFMADDGVCDSDGITTACVSEACLRLPSKCDYAAIRTFLRFLSKANYTDRDYSFIVPHYKRPQPMPSVYSIEELQQIEAAVNLSAPSGKRNYAMLLLSTRLGIRTGDIVTMTFDEFDFRSETVRITQQKTGAPLELPMPSVIREALLDYIKSARGNSISQYVFLSVHPPFTKITGTNFGRIVRSVIKNAGVNPGHRRSGPHAMRSSLASSMINDNVPYEVVRRALGHTGINAIKSYARLDAERLKLYTLEPPVATGCFADILSERCLAK